MRLKEIFIQRYGPIRPFHTKFKKSTCIIFGPGGSGKTLTIDAVLKMLLGENAREYVRHSEIEENPTGYLVIEKDGQEFKLDERKHLSDIPGLKLDPSELKNIFVIQDADLQISDEDRFYGRVTGKLIGVRTEDVQTTKEELRERGRLTPALSIVSKQPHRVGAKQSDASELRSEVNDYIEKAVSEGTEKLEKEKFELKWNVKRLQDEIDLLQKAKKKSEFNKLELAFGEAKKSLQELGSFLDKNMIAQLSVKLEGLKKEKAMAPQLEMLKKSWKDRSQYLTISTAISFIACIALNQILLSLTIPLILFTATIVSFYKWHQSEKSLIGISAKTQSLISEAKAVGVKAQGLEEAEQEILGISGLIDEKQSIFNQKKGILGDGLEIKEKEPERFLEKSQNALESIRQGIDFEVSIDYDKEKLENAVKQRTEKQERLEKVEELLQKHQEALQEFSERAQKLQFADKWSDFKLDIEIRNLESLGKLADWLNNFIDHIANDAELSREAFKVFEKLESQEEAKSEELFSKGNQASIIFRDITAGMFEDVSYDSSARQILVRRSHEKRLQKASELSRSEWTQLYTSIRVALGEKLLEGEKGFFLVEEPFIHADPERLLKELDMLKNLSERGWQTIYFTAKSEIREELPKLLDVDIIELARLP